MPGYALFCTTCKKSLESRASWIRHLLHEGHQKAARSEIGRWGAAERKTGLVVYASFPVSTDSSGGRSLLEHFSSAAADFLVTDFVAIPELPQVAVVQFECKTRAREVLEKAGGAKISIDGQLVQLRKADDYLELEWQALLSKVNSEGGGGGGELSSNVDVRKRKQIDEQEGSDDDEQDNDNPNKKAKETSGANNLQKLVKGPVPPAIPSTKLRSQYDGLCKSVEIPDEEFNIAIQFVETLQNVASSKWPLCKLYMFRTWYLQLRNMGGTELYLFIDERGYISGGQRIDKEASRFDYGQIINAVFSVETSKKLEEVGMKFTQRRRRDTLKNVPEFECSHKASGVNFTVRQEVHQWLVEEVQACRMLKYLITFDVRVQPLYTLIFYWTNMNHVKLSTPQIGYSELNFTPEPAALEWLIMLFLCHKKIVPTPREILDRESPARIPVIKDDVDMGFLADTNFASGRRQSSRESLPPEDSDDFVLSILELVEAFFSFCIGLSSSGSWILNPRDGEIIKTRDFVNNEAPGITKLTESERDAVRKLRNANFLVAGLREPNFLGLLHPLHLKHRFAFTDEIFIKNVIPVMKTTTKKLEQFLQDRDYRENVLSSRVKNLKYLFYYKKKK